MSLPRKYGSSQTIHANIHVEPFPAYFLTVIFEARVGYLPEVMLLLSFCFDVCTGGYLG